MNCIAKLALVALLATAPASMAAVMIAAEPGIPAFVPVTSPTQLAVSDQLDWGDLGPSGTFVPQPFHAIADGGLGMTIWKNNSTQPYQRVDQGNGYVGGFASGDHLLYAFSPTAFDLLFDRPIRGITTQIQRSEIGPFTGYVRAYSGAVQVAEFQIPAVTTTASNGTATFVGVLSDRPNITRVLFDSYGGGWCYINKLVIEIPEPATASLLLLAVPAVQRRSRTPRRS